MRLVQHLQGTKYPKYSIQQFDVNNALFDKEGIVFSKKLPIIKIKLLVIEAVDEIDLDSKKDVEKILTDIGMIRKEFFYSNFLNVLVINWSSKKTKNLFFVNDLLKMEISFVNVDDESESILFHKQGYAFSSEMRKIVVEKIALLLNYKANYI